MTFLEFMAIVWSWGIGKIAFTFIALIGIGALIEIYKDLKKVLDK